MPNNKTPFLRMVCGIGFATSTSYVGHCTSLLHQCFRTVKPQVAAPDRLMAWWLHDPLERGPPETEMFRGRTWSEGLTLGMRLNMFFYTEVGAKHDFFPGTSFSLHDINTGSGLFCEPINIAIWCTLPSRYFWHLGFGGLSLSQLLKSSSYSSDIITEFLV